MNDRPLHGGKVTTNNGAYLEDRVKGHNPSPNLENDAVKAPIVELVGYRRNTVYKHVRRRWGVVLRAQCRYLMKEESISTSRFASHVSFSFSLPFPFVLLTLLYIYPANSFRIPIRATDDQLLRVISLEALSAIRPAT